jgi:hypothetical protein
MSHAGLRAPVHVNGNAKDDNAATELDVYILIPQPPTQRALVVRQDFHIPLLDLQPPLPEKVAQDDRHAMSILKIASIQYNIICPHGRHQPICCVALRVGAQACTLEHNTQIFCMPSGDHSTEDGV